ncbi:hypothetical protein GCM10009765_44030 [Fodinicola feengrottensis]|uniref:Transcriptional regulator TetR C-terminal Proteobacteria type domain-containing protein n=1 Tax=Fodinicola feengrottensis TaxID=435914 RepID=A0ABP4TML4_9ACTN
MRRLIIGESSRFPDLGRLYWEQGFTKGLTTLANAVRDLSKAGHLTVADTDQAASQFAALILRIPVNQALLRGHDTITDTEIAGHIQRGTDAFLTLYHRNTNRSPGTHQHPSTSAPPTPSTKTVRTP